MTHQASHAEATDLEGVHQSANELSPVTCSGTCKHVKSTKSKQSIPMIRCCLCAIWFHLECVGLKKSDEVGVWPCPSCRMMPSQVRDLKENVSQLIRSNNNLLAANAELKVSINRILQLFETLGTRSKNEDDSAEDSDDDEEEIEPCGTLLLGDSLVRDVKAVCDDLEVNSLSGAKFCDLQKFLREINPKKKKFTDIIVVCGTNET